MTTPSTLAPDTPVLDSANTYANQVDINTGNTGEGFLKQTGQFIAAFPGAVVSDAVNSTGAIIKFFGGDGFNVDEHSIIDQLDGLNMGAANYYDTHKGLVDGAELLATSLIPGTLGIKALRGAQAGISGFRVLTGLGLDMFNPSTLNAARLAAQAKAVQATTTWNAITSELGGALAKGLGAQTLDMAAFGATAMIATNASPIYDGMTPTDMIRDWATSTAFMGALGGVGSGIKTMYGIRGAVIAKDLEALKTGNINTGNEFAPAPLRIAQTIGSYSDALKNGTPTNSVTNAVKSQVTALAQGMLPESDKGAQVVWGNFATKFLEATPAGTPASVEAANMFGKLQSVRRVTGKIAENELHIDTSDGSIYPNRAAAPVHLGDEMGASGSLRLGTGDTVKMDLGNGKSTLNLDAGGFDADSLLNTQAAIWRAQIARTLEKETPVTIKNIPFAERALADATAAQSEGKALPTKFVDGSGNAIAGLDNVSDTLKQMKLQAISKLAANGETPENIAAALNVSGKFIQSGGGDALSLRSGRNLQEFLENPRIMVAKYDIGSTEGVFKTGARAGEAKITANAFSASSRNFISGQSVENAFNRTLQGNYFPERLVTSPVISRPTETYEYVGKNGKPYYITHDAYANNTLTARTAEGELVGTMSVEPSSTGPNFPADMYVVEAHRRQGINSAMQTIAKREYTNFDAKNSGALTTDGQVFSKGSRNVKLTAVPDTSSTQANTALYEQQARQYLENVASIARGHRELVSNAVLGATSTIVKEVDLLKAINAIDSTQSGASLFASANGGYGSFESMTQKIGAFVKQQSDAAAKKTFAQISNAVHQLANDTTLASEMQLLRSKLGKTSADYVLDPDYIAGTEGLQAKLVRQDLAINRVKQEQAVAKGSKDFPRVAEMEGDETINISQKLMDEVLIPHTDLNTQRLTNRIQTDNAMMPGSSGNAALDHGLTPMYNIPVNTNMHSHFFFVTEKSQLVGNGSGPSMIMAPSADALLAKRASIEGAFPGRFDFHTKGDTAAFYKALGDYQYSRGMNTSSVDSSMKRLGILGDMTPTIGTDGAVAKKLALQLAEDFQSFHQRAAIREVRDAVSMRYADVIQRLDFLGKQYEDVALSKFAPSKQLMLQSESVNNPYSNVKNMLVDRSTPRDFPMWQSANAWLEKTGDRAFAAVSNGWSNLLDSGLTGARLDAEVDKLNKMAQGVGLEPLYTKGMVAQFGDQLPVRPVLRSFISKTQAALNGMMLGLDPMQAVNNALGQIMFAGEFSSLIKAIERGDSSAGALKDLIKVQVPGQDFTMNSAVKLHAMASKAFVAGGDFIDYSIGQVRNYSRKELIQQYGEQHGLLTNISKQFDQQLDDMTFSAKTPTDAQLGDTMNRILDRGRILTGNNVAEEYVRFVAVHAARLLTDEAFKAGLISDEAVASTYWNTMVNRVHGVNVASQRAQIFQGAIGHAIGMFMSYQHNMFQQLFRYVGTGDNKAVAALMGSQLGLYGIQGLPAFNAVSTHIIGNAAGNTQHSDAYTWTARNMDMQLPGNSTAAEWILYGAGSNALGLVHPDLKFNLYSRGDINPRQLTLFPTSVTDTVLYTATAGAVKNIFDAVGNIMNGADVKQSLIHGLEHNSINRPLSGLGAALGGAQTTVSGKNLGSTDLNNTGSPFDKWTIANFVRLAGAKPLDDAAAADSMYRVAAYQAKTTSDIKELSEIMRISTANGNVPDAATMQKFMQEYAKRGGDIRNFRGFVANAYKTANNNQVLALAQRMQSMGGRQVQSILGATNDRAWMQLMNPGESGGIGE